MHSSLISIRKTRLVSECQFWTLWTKSQSWHGLKQESSSLKLEADSKYACSTMWHTSSSWWYSNGYSFLQFWVAWVLNQTYWLLSSGFPLSVSRFTSLYFASPCCFRLHISTRRWSGKLKDCSKSGKSTNELWETVTYSSQTLSLSRIEFSNLLLCNWEVPLVTYKVKRNTTKCWRTPAQRTMP